MVQKYEAIFPGLSVTERYQIIHCAALVQRTSNKKQITFIYFYYQQTKLASYTLSVDFKSLINRGWLKENNQELDCCWVT